MEQAVEEQAVEERTAHELISGVDQITDAAEEPIEVVLDALLADGEPFAVKVLQPDPLRYFSLGRSIPIPPGKNLNPREWSHEERVKYHHWKRDLCAACLVEVREAFKYSEDENADWDSLPWQSRWVEARVVKKVTGPSDNPGGPKLIAIDRFDKKDNTKRVYQALMVDAEYGGDFSDVVGCPFRSERSSADDDVSGEVREVAARDSAPEE